MLYDERNAKALKRMDTVAQKAFGEFLKNLEAIGEDVLLYDGKRSKTKQNELYSRGRTKEGRVVTHVKGEDSFHVWGLAVDLVPVGMFGRLLWRDKRRYRKVAEVARKLEIQWGFDMWGFDMPHFQYTQGLSIADLKRGDRLSLQKWTSERFLRTPARYSAQTQVKRLERGIRRSTGNVRLMLQRQLARLRRRARV